MHGFRQFFETHAPENFWLRSYLKDRDLDLPNHIYWFLQWSGANAVLRRARISRKKLEADDGDFTDEFYKMAEKIQKVMTDEEKGDFAATIAQHDPAGAPSWSHFDYEKTVKPQTWLIHFTDAHDTVGEKGFEYGTDDMTKLGLTTYFRQESKKYGGYNFAFEADGRYARSAAAEGKYGGHAVLFQAAGIEVYHYGDEERQVIFWGKAINPANIITLEKIDGGDWGVKAKYNSRMDRSGRQYAYHGDFEKVVDWAINNHGQYRRQIMDVPKQSKTRPLSAQKRTSTSS